MARFGKRGKDGVVPGPQNARPSLDHIVESNDSTGYYVREKTGKIC
jgi:hypothetical protein